MGQSYDRVAGRYEARFVDELEGKPGDRRLLEAFAASVGDPVVDLGCGPGQIGAYLGRHGRKVVGADLSFEMAKLARGRLRAAAMADMRALPFAAGRLAALVAYYSLIHLQREELSLALDEAHRVLRPGGRVLFTVHEGQGEVHVDEFLDEQVPFSATFFALDELVGVCRTAGLDVTRTERREAYPSELPTVRLYVEATRPVRVA